MRVAESLWLCLLVLGMGESMQEKDLEAKCNVMVEKVIPCLNFLTWKIKESDPECLCYVIEQTHKGRAEVKSMGIQEPTLLHLPTACNLKNASASNCPKLLGLSPNSPDAAIFTNASSGNSSASPAGTKTPVSENFQNNSYGSMLRPSLMAYLVALFSLPVIPITVSVTT